MFIWKNFEIYSTNYYSYCEELYNYYNSLLLDDEKYKEFNLSTDLFHCSIELLKIVKNFNIFNENHMILPSFEKEGLNNDLNINTKLNFLPFLLVDNYYKFSLILYGNEYDVTSHFRNSFNNFLNNINSNNQELDQRIIVKNKFDIIMKLIKQYIPLKDCFLSSNDVSLCIRSDSNTLSTITTPSSTYTNKDELNILINSFFNDLFNTFFYSTLKISNFYQQYNPDLPTVALFNLEIYDLNHYKILDFSKSLTI